eukprot:TRINITY_DN78_c0_g1_i8.p1 TRINITY_DN78_c0_g1~~TRINITY_DN78_c0_g1_i8.p1  ORF type:complete len:136 (+),score=14.38 TRINITY_DN78_c0_g1_i8:51-458(+)
MYQQDLMQLEPSTDYVDIRTNQNSTTPVKKKDVIQQAKLVQNAKRIMFQYVRSIYKNFTSDPKMRVLVDKKVAPGSEDPYTVSLEMSINAEDGKLISLWLYDKSYEGTMNFRDERLQVVLSHYERMIYSAIKDPY